MNRTIESARKIYIDANVIIYFLEGSAVFRDRAIELFKYVDAHDIPVLTSEISIAECLYGAYRRGNEAIAEKYRELFHDEIGMFRLIPIERDICELAAKLGAEQKFKLIDALHVASALAVGCDVFVTNDRAIKPAAHLKVVQIFE